MVLSVRMQFNRNALEAMMYYTEAFGVSPAEQILSDEEMMGHVTLALEKKGPGCSRGTWRLGV